MTARQSSAVDRALAMIGKPKRRGGVHTAYSAAQTCKIALSTIYRALKRQPNARSPTPSHPSARDNSLT